VTSTRAATLRERPVPVGLLFPYMSERIGSRKAKAGNPQTAGRRGVCGAGILTRHLGPLVRFLRERDFVTNMLRVMRDSDARARVYV
jgi:hypothetical protein